MQVYLQLAEAPELQFIRKFHFKQQCRSWEVKNRLTGQESLIYLNRKENYCDDTVLRFGAV
jgi:hypothetical protein